MMDRTSLIEWLRLGPDRVATRGPGCPDEELLAAFADGDLEDGAALEVREHLADCDYCLGAIGFLAEMTGADVPEAAVSLPKPEAPRWRHRFRTTVVSQVVKRAGPFGRKRLSRRQPSRWSSSQT